MILLLNRMPSWVTSTSPERGDSVEWDGLKLQVLEVEGARIDRLTIVFEEPNEEHQAEVVAGG